MDWIWVFFGAGFGGVVRYGTQLALNRAPQMPWGTLLVNVVGSFLVGLFLAWESRQSMAPPNARLFLATGFLGGFTTFSAFSAEFHQLATTSPLKALGYAALTILLGLGAVYLGFRWPFAV